MRTSLSITNTRTRIAAVLIAFGVSSLLLQSQSTSGTGSTASERTYHLLREDDDWSFLADPAKREETWDRLKYIPLRQDRDDWFLSIGGEARELWQQVGNDNWGQAHYMNSYLNERYMLNFDMHYGRQVRSFVELKSGLNSFRIGGPRPIDEKRLDFQAAFLELGTPDGDNATKFRIGRQEMQYGSGRLIDVREGPNVRMSFDGFKVKTVMDRWHIDGFAMRPDLDKEGLFDNVPDHTTSFWGVYGTRPLMHTTTLDAYYLGLDRKSAVFNRGTAQETRHSIGARFSHPANVARGGWDFDYEGLWQFGNFGSANVRAWTLSSDTGYRFQAAPLKPRLNFKADVSSGDHDKPGTLETFYPLFPRGNYFGVLSSVGPGPMNFMDVHPHVDAILHPGLTVSADWLFFWRQSLEDGVYSVPGFLIVPAGKSNARSVGNSPATQVHWQVNRHLWMQADYSVFYAGQFVKESQTSHSLTYWSLWTSYKF